MWFKLKMKKTFIPRLYPRERDDNIEYKNDVVHYIFQTNYSP